MKTAKCDMSGQPSHERPCLRKKTLTESFSIGRRVKPGIGSFVMVCVMLAGCNLLPVGQGRVYASPETPTARSVDDASQLMYEVMIAELAGRRGMLDIATEGYYAASQRTDDPRVSERATRLAVWNRSWQQAQETGQRWAILEPENIEVRQLLAQVFLRQGNSVAAADELAMLISMSQEATASESGDLRETMQDVFTLLVREPNRKVSVEAMTALRDRYADDSYANLALAQLAYNAKDRAAALDAVDRAIVLDGSNSEARLLRAQILAASGEVDKGFAELNLALEKDPDNIDLHLGYARLLVEAGRYKQAATELDIIYSLGQDNASALFTIGLLALESKRTEPAEKYFSRLTELDQFTSEAHFYLGTIADTRYDYATAIEHYESVSSGDSYLNAQIRAAELYGSSGRMTIGRERLQQLAMENPDPELRPRLIRAEGRMLIEAGNHAEAVKVLSTGIELYPDDVDLLYSRGLAAENSGDDVLFQRDIRRLIELDPDHAHGLNALGYHFADENTNLEEAAVYLEKASALLPQDPAIMDSLGWLRYRTGDFEESIELLRRAYQILPDPEIAAHLGEVLWVSGEQESAKEVWTRALKQTPDDEKLQSVMRRFVP